MCELASRSREPRVASLFLPATTFFFFVYLFIFWRFQFNVKFSSVNGALGRRNTSFRFSFVCEIPRIIKTGIIA